MHFICCCPHSVFSFKVMATIDLYWVTCKISMIDEVEGDSGCPWKLFFPLKWCSFPRDDRSFYKPGFSNPKYHHFSPRAYFHRRDHFQPKLHHIALREKEREKEKERYEQRESADGSSPPKQNNGEFASAAKVCENNNNTHTPFNLFEHLWRDQVLRDFDKMFTLGPKVIFLMVWTTLLCSN